MADAVDDPLEVLSSRKNLDRDAQIKASDGSRLEARESHRILLGRYQRVGADVGRTVQRVEVQKKIMLVQMELVA